MKPTSIKVAMVIGFLLGFALTGLISLKEPKPQLPDEAYDIILKGGKWNG